jgi:ketosteroid isomerase-like protein
VNNVDLLAAFNEAFGSRDLDGSMALVTDDVVFESTSPAPDGTRHVGADAVRRAWADVFATKDLRFTEEDSLVEGERGFVQWRFDWTSDDGSPGHVRGVDILRFRDGKVAEKLSYVKG